MNAGQLIGILGVSIPIIAIVLGIGTGMLKIFLESQEKRLEMKLRLQKGIDSAVKEQIEALRAEIASLRDTSTQFDMSLQHTLEGMQSRVQALESQRSSTHPPARAAEQEEQVLRAGRT